MRSALWLVVAGCWNAAPRPAPPPSAAPVAVCDPARWRELAGTMHRAWLVSLDEPHAHRAGGRPRGAWQPREPVRVIAIDDDDVQVATVRDGLIAARWVAASGLGRSARGTVSVSSSPGGLTDPWVRIHRGYRLPADEQPWLSVKHAPAEHDGLDFDGFVPAGIRGAAWVEPPRPAPAAPVFRHDGVILHAPYAGARIRATVTRDAEIEIRGEQRGFWEITARTRYAEVDGFIPKPPLQSAPPRAGERTYEFSDEQLEGVLELPDGPLPPGTCLYDAPGGQVAGMILGPQPADPRPVPSAPGWLAVELATIWGTVTYYVVAPD